MLYNNYFCINVNNNNKICKNNYFTKYLQNTYFYKIIFLNKFSIYK